MFSILNNNRNYETNIDSIIMNYKIIFEIIEYDNFIINNHYNYETIIHKKMIENDTIP